jgi:colicin import membrane protein
VSTALDPRAAGPAVEADPFLYGWRMVRELDPAGKETWKQVPLTLEDVLHPQEGDFLVETPVHNHDRDYLHAVLKARTADEPGTVVLQDCRVDWGVAGVKAHGPDVALFRDVAAWDPTRGTFYVAELHARPVLVVEITSPGTRHIDLGAKVVEYFRAGVPLYAIVDGPVGDEGRTIRMLGYRATAEGYVPLPLNEQGQLWLEPVRLWLGTERGQAACYDENGKQLGDYQDVVAEAREAEARAEAEKARAEAEKARAEAAEARLQEVEAELRRLRGKGEA